MVEFIHPVFAEMNVSDEYNHYLKILGVPIPTLNSQEKKKLKDLLKAFLF